MSIQISKKRIREVVGKGTVDPVKLLLFATYDTLFVDLFSVLGPHLALRFIRIFGGTTIKVPSIDDVKVAVRDFQIFRELHSLRMSARREKEDQLAARYGIPRIQVCKIFDRVKEIEDREIMI